MQIHSELHEKRLQLFRAYCGYTDQHVGEMSMKSTVAGLNTLNKCVAHSLFRLSEDCVGIMV